MKRRRTPLFRRVPTHRASAPVPASGTRIPDFITQCLRCGGACQREAGACSCRNCGTVFYVVPHLTMQAEYERVSGLRSAEERALVTPASVGTRSGVALPRIRAAE